MHEATTQTLAELDEPLRIHGYFSEKTHPLLAPLVPRLQSLLEGLFERFPQPLRRHRGHRRDRGDERG